MAKSIGVWDGNFLEDGVLKHFLEIGWPKNILREGNSDNI